MHYFDLFSGSCFLEFPLQMFVVNGNFTGISIENSQFNSFIWIHDSCENNKVLTTTFPCRLEHQISGPENILTLVFASKQSRARDDYSSGIVNAPWHVKRLCAGVTFLKLFLQVALVVSSLHVGWSAFVG